MDARGGYPGGPMAQNTLHMVENMTQQSKV